MGNIFEQLNVIKGELKWLNNLKQNSKCFVPNCECRSIDSHSISKNQVLALLAEKRKEGDILYKLQDKPLINYEDKHLDTYQNMHRELEQVDKSQASVFRGYCDEHDPLFNHIDNNKFDDSDVTRFLHSVRTLSYGLVSTEQQLEHLYSRLIPEMEKIDSLDLSAFQSLDNVLEKIPDEHEFGYTDYVQIQSGLRELVNNSPNKKDLLNGNKQRFILDTFNKAQFPMRGIEFKSKLSAMLAGSMVGINQVSLLVQQLKSGRKLYERNEKFASDLTTALINSEVDFINSKSFVINEYFLIAGSFNIEIYDIPFALTFFPEQNPNRTVFIVGTPLRNTVVDRLYSKMNIMPTSELLIFFSNLILKQGGNVFLSPYYYNSLSDGLKSDLIKPKRVDERMNESNLFDKELISL